MRLLVAASNAEIPPRVRSVRDVRCTAVVTEYDFVKYLSLNFRWILLGLIYYLASFVQCSDIVRMNRILQAKARKQRPSSTKWAQGDEERMQGIQPG